MNNKKNYIIGCGGFSKDVYCILKRNNQLIENFIGLDETPIIVENKTFFPLLQKNFLNDINPNTCNLYIGIGNPSILKSIKEIYINFNFPNLFDPDAKILGKINCGQGNIFCCNSILTTDISVGSFNVFNISCTIGHDTCIGNCNVFNPTACISGNVKIDNNNLFGVNSTVLQNIKISSDNIIGASALISKNINESGIYVGIPAKRKD